MPTPEQRDDPNTQPAVNPLDPRLLELVRKLDSEFTDARAQQCTCSALYTNPECPTHGPLFTRHLENRK